MREQTSVSCAIFQNNSGQGQNDSFIKMIARTREQCLHVQRQVSSLYVYLGVSVCLSCFRSERGLRYAWCTFHSARQAQKKNAGVVLA